MTDISTGHMLHSDARLPSKAGEKLQFSDETHARWRWNTEELISYVRDCSVETCLPFVTDSVNNCCERVLSYMGCVCECVFTETSTLSLLFALNHCFFFNRPCDDQHGHCKHSFGKKQA